MIVRHRSQLRASLCMQGAELATQDSHLPLESGCNTVAALMLTFRKHATEYWQTESKVRGLRTSGSSKRMASQGGRGGREGGKGGGYLAGGGRGHAGGQGVQLEPVCLLPVGGGDVGGCQRGGCRRWAVQHEALQPCKSIESPSHCPQALSACSADMGHTWRWGRIKASDGPSKPRLEGSRFLIYTYLSATRRPQTSEVSFLSFQDHNSARNAWI